MLSFSVWLVGWDMGLVMSFCHPLVVMEMGWQAEAMYAYCYVWLVRWDMGLAINLCHSLVVMEMGWQAEVCYACC